MRSARSASSDVVDGLWAWLRPRAWRWWPRWPSLVAVVERVDSEVVVDVGVPL
jgi:hypothetical protein